ncbi:unnamed protein product [Brachionus calyciflorus]|uniref:Condensin complex subunit 1 n=1 Tax=Brachionus calyciflorus TaxID=104777 RepID=A0A813ZS38_9BILA|nr:unnamed protein product [Brachionus calyciflorus]
MVVCSTIFDLKKKNYSEMATFIDALLPSVHDTLTLREALSKLAQCERSIKSNGVCSIIENFNIIYSCLCNVTDLKTETLDEIMKTLIKGLQLIESDLKKILSDKIPSETRIKYLNSLKILIYLTVEFSNFFEKKFLTSKENDLLTQTNNKKTTKKTTGSKKTHVDLSINESSSHFDWNDIKENVLACLANIVDLNIQKLWDPPIAEEQFVITITNLCYKLMETCQSNSIRPQQRKTIKDHLCHILAIMIKKYNHSYSACVMIVQTLPHYEHFSSIYADLIQTCVTRLGYESILPDILRELTHTNMSSGTGNKENPNIKFYSQFLIDLADRLAENFLPYLSMVQEFQDEESYLMRNSVLYIYGEILVKVLNKENVTDLKTKQARDELLDNLMEHIHDVNAVARSKTLQIWRRLSDENSIPLHYINELMKRCVGRMEDIASSVRKSAFQLLCDLIRTNPFGIKSVELSLQQIQSELVKEEEVLNNLNKESDKLIDELNSIVEPKNSEEMNEEESDEENSQSNQENEVELQAAKDKHQQLVVIQKSKVNYLKDMLSFVNQIETAIPKLSKLLFSKTQTDVLEVISFFVTCYEHGFTDMLFGIRKMLALIVNSEKTIKDAVINAYKRLYLKSESRHNPLQIAKHLLKLTEDLSICERGALEELIGEFVINGELEGSVIQIFWELFSDLEKPVQTRFHSILLLSMIIKKIPGKGRANIDVLIDYGLSSPKENQITDQEILIFSETCLALSNVTPDVSSKQLTQQDPTSVIKETSRKNKKNKDNDDADTSYVQPRLQFKNEPFKLVNTHQLFERLTEILTKEITSSKLTKWSCFMENAITCIIKLADNPILIIENIALKIIDKISPLKSLMTKSPPLFNEPTQDQTQLNDEIKTDSLLLSRYYSMIGVISSKLLVFLVQFVVCELKRRKMCKESQDNSKNSKNGSKNRRKSIRPNKSLNRQSLGGDANLEEDMGLQGAEAEDAELMFVESVIDQKVAVSQAKAGVFSLLATQLLGIIYILKEHAKFPDENLQLSCALALVRIMALSQKICNENLQLLFTLMEKSPNPKVRSQLIIGIGDLVYRFPNALEPWTSHLYLPLRDTKSNAVRMNTIRVLSHLILKEMIKTRGQIFEIALCTIDDDIQISSLSKLFFQELSQRNNGLVIYNAMPDIISQLSGGGGSASSSTNDEIYAARVITEESFRQIVTYLFTFIKRDKQCETLIEKLCHGFRQANITERKCRDLVFCLSKIQLSENGIKKLKETFKWYADKLIYPAVYDTFKQTILKNARKLPILKTETKALIDELEKQIDEIKQKGLTDDMKGNDESLNEDKESESDSENQPASGQVGKKQNNNNKKSTVRNQSVLKQSQKVNVNKKASCRSNTTRTRRKVVDSSSGEDDSSDNDGSMSDSE